MGLTFGCSSAVATANKLIKPRRGLVAEVFVPRVRSWHIYILCFCYCTTALSGRACPCLQAQSCLALCHNANYKADHALMGCGGRLTPVREESLHAQHQQTRLQQGPCLASGLSSDSKGQPDEETTSHTPPATRTGPSNGAHLRQLLP